MTAKEYLSQIYKADRRINLLIRQKQDLRALLFSIGASVQDLQSDHVASSPDPDRISRLVSKIDAKERRIVREIDRLADLKERISGQISQLEDSRYVEILTRRYVLCEAWSVVASATGYSEQSVYRIHGAALLAFEKIMPMMEDESK